MDTRVGRVTAVDAGTGRVKVAYDDTGSSSLYLAMLTMNSEYSMPAVGDRVVTMHMQNGSSKGFVLGTYYGGGTAPNANTGYRKDFDGTAYVTCNGGAYVLVTATTSIKGDQVALNGGGAKLALAGTAALSGEEVLISYAAASEDESETALSEDDEESEEPDVFVKLDETLLEAKGKEGVNVTASEGPVDILAEEAEAELVLDETSTLKAKNFEAEFEEDAQFTCAYGYIGLEELLRRIERIEDQLGLDHDTFKE